MVEKQLQQQVGGTAQLDLTVSKISVLLCEKKKKHKWGKGVNLHEKKSSLIDALSGPIFGAFYLSNKISFPV